MPYWSPDAIRIWGGNPWGLAQPPRPAAQPLLRPMWSPEAETIYGNAGMLGPSGALPPISTLATPQSVAQSAAQPAAQTAAAGTGGGWTGGVPGQFGIPAEVAPAALRNQVAATLEQAPAGATTLKGAQVPRGTDQPINPNAVMAVPPRQQLAQLMAPPPQPQPQPYYGHGPNYGSQGGSTYGGYTTSGPQYGGAGGQGGWGRSPGGGRSSANKGGLYGGGLY